MVWCSHVFTALGAVGCSTLPSSCSFVWWISCSAELLRLSWSMYAIYARIGSNHAGGVACKAMRGNVWQCKEFLVFLSLLITLITWLCWAITCVYRAYTSFSSTLMFWIGHLCCWARRTKDGKRQLVFHYERWSTVVVYRGLVLLNHVG